MSIDANTERSQGDVDELTISENMTNGIQHGKCDVILFSILNRTAEFVKRQEIKWSKVQRDRVTKGQHSVTIQPHQLI